MPATAPTPDLTAAPTTAPRAVRTAAAPGGRRNAWRPRAALGTLAAVGVLGVTGCGSSGLSIGDRVTTVQVCGSALSAVQQAAAIGISVATQQTSPADAQTKLKPVQAKIAGLAQAHGSLPVGQKLMALNDALTALGAVSGSNPNDYVTAAKPVSSAASAVVAACAKVGA